MLKELFRFFDRNQFKYNEKDFIDYDYLQNQIIENEEYLSNFSEKRNKDLLSLYQEYGFDWELSPNPLFNHKFYLRNLNIDAKKTTKIKKKYGSLFNHFLNHGYKNNIDPSEFFSFKYIKNNYEIARSQNFWTQFLKDNRFFSMNVSENFTNLFYLLNNPDVKESGLNPLFHYLKYGISEGRAAKANIIFDYDDYLDPFGNTSVSRKLIKPLEKEPLHADKKLIYSMKKDINIDENSITFVISDPKSRFLYPVNQKIQVRNDLNSCIRVDIYVNKMEKDFTLSKIKQLLNGNMKCDYIKIIFESGANPKDLSFDKEIINWIDFLIIKMCSEAKPVIVQGESIFTSRSQCPRPLLEFINEKSKQELSENLFSLYKYGQELRKRYIDYCTGMLIVNDKINDSTFTLKNTKIKLPTVTIITCTNRPDNLLKHTVRQVTQQRYPNLEWVILVQGAISEPNELAIMNLCKSVGIICKLIHVESSIRLGTMLNLGVSHSSGEYIAKFDDDDFYLPNYLINSMTESIANQADMVGKWMEFTYYENEDKVYYDVGPTLNYMDTEHITGSSLVFKRSLFSENFRFYDVTHGEDVFFRNLLVNSGKKVFRINGFDHIIFRGKNLSNHTWQITDRYLKNETYLRNNELDITLNLSEALTELELN